MSLITAGELATARADQARTFSDTLTLKRKAQASNGRGGQTDTLTTVASNVPCRFALSTKSDNAPREIAERIKTKPAWVLACAVTVDVRENDVVTVAGLTLQVIFVEARSHQTAQRFWAVEP